MEYSDIIIYVMELVGTVAFAVSGAMTAIQKRMDLSRVCHFLRHIETKIPLFCKVFLAFFTLL